MLRLRNSIKTLGANKITHPFQGVTLYKMSGLGFLRRKPPDK